MSKMNTPGFTAEFALYSDHDRYQNRARLAPNPQVIPQAIDVDCYMRRFKRTWLRCA